jgi:putative hydrolase of the HAD superfamily
VTGRRTLVFDVGGVIARWEPDALMRQCFAELAADAQGAARVKALVFQSHELGGDWAAFDRGAIEPEALAERIAERSGLPLAGLRALIAAIPDHLQPMAPSVALLERLRGTGHRLALLSNMPRPYADHLEATHECFGWFEQRAWSGRLGLMKPERAVFDHLQAALGLDDPAQALFVDDHPANVEAARRCGWGALRFVTAEQCAADLRAAGWL